MGAEAHYDGSAPLKDGTKFNDIFDLYVAGPGWPDDVVEDGATCFEESQHGHIHLSVENGEFIYSIDADVTSSWPDDFEKMLDTVATRFASAGWTSMEDTRPVWRGPTFLACAEARFAWTKAELEAATDQHERACQELRLQGGTP